MGLCPSMTHNSHLQQVTGQHILSSLSPRLDHPGQTFKFSKSGYGDTPIAAFNLRKLTDQTMDYLKVSGF